MGICGADPVAVTEGMDNLSPVGDDEQATLDRLGFAANTRMACCARVRGPVAVACSRPDRTVARLVHVGARYDASVRRMWSWSATGSPALRRPTTRAARTRAARSTRRPRALPALQPHGHHAADLRPLGDAGALPPAGCVVRAARDHAPGSTPASMAIDPAARTVTLGTGEILEYDRLILATGGRSVVPQIEGFGAPGLLRPARRRARDAPARVRAAPPRPTRDRRRRRAARPRSGRRPATARSGSAGAGAWPLAAAAPGRRARRADAAGLSRRARHRGAHRSGGDRGRGRAGRGDARCASGTAGRCRATSSSRAPGCVPTRRSPSRPGSRSNQGVVVDDRMQTSAPGVYAAGDIAEHDGRLYGIWPASVAQGEAAGVNAAGGERTYSGTVPATILKINGAELVSVGRIAQQDGDEVISLRGARGVPLRAPAGPRGPHRRRDHDRPRARRDARRRRRAAGAPDRRRAPRAAAGRVRGAGGLRRLLK